MGVLQSVQKKKDYDYEKHGLENVHIEIQWKLSLAPPLGATKSGRCRE